MIFEFKDSLYINIIKERLSYDLSLINFSQITSTSIPARLSQSNR